MAISGKKFSIFCISWLLLSLQFIACRKSDPEKPDYPAGSNEKINSWVLDSMRVYYYWQNSLPSNPEITKAPLDFFSSIKSTEDRFSKLVNPTLPESYYPSLVHNFGFDLAIYRDSSGETKTVVTLVVPGTIAEHDGLKRGSIILSINQTTPSAINAPNLIAASIKQRKIVLKLQQGEELILGAAIVAENPVYKYKIISSAGKSIAYLFLNSFEGRSKYDLQNAFAYFKQNNATELILDLRYNPGGDIAMSAVMAAAIAQVQASDVFIEYRGNKNAPLRRENFASTIANISAGYNFSFEEIASMRLQIKQVFILTGNHTASAAEFLIKGLRPWLSVIQVGQKTLGKDMASFQIKENENTHTLANWSIEPMVFKLFNSNSEGNYPTGLNPDITVDEFSEDLIPFGDQADPLIKTAIGRIAGESLKRSSLSQNNIQILFDSRDMIDQIGRSVSVTKVQSPPKGLTNR
ncbi:PDZ domain-containing protein [Pedobacter panaciterrae]|jgi:Periplasmic protease|uniref:S41 family peptidase n=1 Tax=Pedobacter panaciterrae TaxID=363849 RepID=UPI00155DC886|nr:S41 family peptidase [Pedobacter panaciterrae]NQX53159.1 PDZ domain-containing protein [Pedobacter panaciterrae]